MNQGRTKGEGWSTANFLTAPLPPSNFIAGCHRAAHLFWLFGDCRCGVLLFIVILVIYINIDIGKKGLNVRLAGDHLYRKLPLTWPSQVMSLMMSFYFGVNLQPMCITYAN